MNGAIETQTLLPPPPFSALGDSLTADHSWK